MLQIILKSIPQKPYYVDTLVTTAILISKVEITSQFD
jgi:hypothetical protein